MNIYCQCSLLNELNQSEVHWIPANFARAGKSFRVRRQGGWYTLKVIAVGRSCPEIEVINLGDSRISSKFILDV